MSKVNFMDVSQQQKSFDSMSSAMSNFTAPPTKQDPLRQLGIKKTTTEDVFSRLYQANNSNRNSKSPLRSS